jgi:aminopeptidase YwaD
MKAKALSFHIIICTSLFLLSCSKSEYNRQDLHDAIDLSFDTDEAMDIVNYLSDRWRLRGGGNDGYNESIDYVFQYLQKGGFENVGRINVLEGPLTLKPLAWNVSSASLTLDDGVEIFNLENNPTLVAKYSGTTNPKGVRAEIIDVGMGDKQEDYIGKNVKGRIVLARAVAANVYKLGVEKYGAIGVISDRLSQDEYYDKFPEMVLHEALPFEEKEDVEGRVSWMLKVSPKVGDAIRTDLKNRKVKATVSIKSEFFESTQRTLIAEIPGESKERIVLVAHIDNNKPGANNNASGIAAHVELARILAEKIDLGIIQKPKRTITFLFGAEREGSRQWLASLGEGQDKIQVMINADMAGGAAITGGKYLMEKSPEPTMHLQREEKYTIDADLHSGWGFRPVDIDPYPGHFINDYFWHVVSFRTAQSDLVARKHPFEGGSDHDVFLPLEIPSVLSWHWPDYFISTNMDTPDKVSPEELKNTAVIHGISAFELASGSLSTASELLKNIKVAAISRLNSEQDLIEKYFEENPGKIENGFDQEMELLQRWTQWYKESLASINDFPVEESQALAKQIEMVINELESKSTELQNNLVEKWRD